MYIRFTIPSYADRTPDDAFQVAAVPWRGAGARATVRLGGNVGVIGVALHVSAETSGRPERQRRGRANRR